MINSACTAYCIKETKYCKCGVPKEEIEFREECRLEIMRFNKGDLYKPTLIEVEG
jgi:hypothetical protein